MNILCDEHVIENAEGRLRLAPAATIKTDSTGIEQKLHPAIVSNAKRLPAEIRLAP
jgi:hypothetical protein